MRIRKAKYQREIDHKGNTRRQRSCRIRGISCISSERILPSELCLLWKRRLELFGRLARLAENMLKYFNIEPADCAGLSSPGIVQGTLLHVWMNRNAVGLCTKAFIVWLSSDQWLSRAVSATMDFASSRPLPPTSFLPFFFYPRFLIASNSFEIQLHHPWNTSSFSISSEEFLMKYLA